MNTVLRDRVTLHDAHLKIPALVDLGLAIQEAFPAMAGQALPANREEMVHLIRQLRRAPAAVRG